MTDEAGREARGINDEAPAGSDPYSAYDDFNLPSYVGLASFQKLPWITDARSQLDGSGLEARLLLRTTGAASALAMV